MNMYARLIPIILNVPYDIFTEQKYVQCVF
jgi:hypothetical protein